MPRFSCACGYGVKVSDEELTAISGRKVVCPKCGKVRTAPLRPGAAPVRDGSLIVLGPDMLEQVLPEDEADDVAERSSLPATIRERLQRRSDLGWSALWGGSAFILLVILVWAYFKLGLFHFEIPAELVEKIQKNAQDWGSLLLLLFAVFTSFCIWLLPSIVAAHRRHHNAIPILLINVLAVPFVFLFTLGTVLIGFGVSISITYLIWVFDLAYAFAMVYRDGKWIPFGEGHPRE